MYLYKDGCDHCSSPHLFFLLLGLAEWHMSLSCCLVECPSAELALYHRSFLCSLHHLLFLTSRLIVVALSLLYACSQLQRLGLPLWYFLLSLLLLDFLLDCFSVLH